MASFKNLPAEILLEIITLLPTKSILNCKLVCKQWRNLVCHHPSFSQMHLTHLHNLDSGKFSFLVRCQDQQLHYFEYDDEKHDEKTPIDKTSTRMININPPFTSHRYNVLGSFNGLVCLHGWKDSVYCICNPMTKDYVVLPKFNRDCGDQYVNWSGGFGYLPLTNEYKIVELYKIRKKPHVMEVAVYTLGNGDGWRNVGRFDTKSGEKYGQHGVFVNGVLYWVDKSGGRVFTLDLTDEKFEYLAPPHLLTYNVCHPYTLGVLGEVLYFGNKYFSQIDLWERFDVWLLKKKNDIPGMKVQVEQEPLGWSKEFTLPGPEPLAFTKSDGVLGYNYFHLQIYNSITSNFKYLVYYHKINQIFSHKNTLVSLKELGEEDIKVMESSKTEETEARICQSCSKSSFDDIEEDFVLFP